MFRQSSRRRQILVMRVAAAFIGVGAATLALSADKLGYGDPGSFGIGQLLLFLAGAAMFLVGLLGSKFIGAYQGGAIILLNTIVLLAIVELAAIVIGKSSFQTRQAGIENSSYYSNQDWSQVYWEEASLAQGVVYKPYITWRYEPFSGETLNINREGIRRTPGAECTPDAYKVFTFGGSTMVGWGSPDWGTIAAYLQNGLEDHVEEPVCVVNFAQDGYVSTQSLVALMLELQSGNVPDAVLSYDGINEVLAAWESGQPSAHVTLADIATRFEVREEPLVTWLRGTRTFAIAERWVSQLQPEKSGTHGPLPGDSGATRDTSTLAEAVAETYIANYELVGVLAQAYGFDHYFFLQPHPAVSEKTLTEDELGIMAGMDPGLANLAVEVYDDIALAAPELDRLWYIADVFDSETETIWIDEVGHITPEGNQLVALEMLEAMEIEVAQR